MGKKYANTLKNLARENAAISEAPPEDLLVRSDPHLFCPFFSQQSLERGRSSSWNMEEAPFLKDRDARPPCQCFEVPCLVNIGRSKSNVSFSKKNLSQSGPVPLKINSFGGKKTRSLLLHKMRRCEQAQTGAVVGWRRGNGRQTKEGQEKEEGEANSSQGSLHTGHFGSYYFVNGWSCFEMFRLDKQLK